MNRKDDLVLMATSEAVKALTVLTCLYLSKCVTLFVVIFPLSCPFAKVNDGPILGTESRVPCLWPSSVRGEM